MPVLPKSASTLGGAIVGPAVLAPVEKKLVDLCSGGDLTGAMPRIKIAPIVPDAVRTVIGIECSCESCQLSIVPADPQSLKNAPFVFNFF